MTFLINVVVFFNLANFTRRTTLQQIKSISFLLTFFIYLFIIYLFLDLELERKEWKMYV